MTILVINDYNGCINVSVLDLCANVNRDLLYPYRNHVTDTYSTDDNKFTNVTNLAQSKGFNGILILNNGSISYFHMFN